jgi:hypothetical protein
MKSKLILLAICLPTAIACFLAIALKSKSVELKKQHNVLMDVILADKVFSNSPEDVIAEYLNTKTIDGFGKDGGNYIQNVTDCTERRDANPCSNRGSLRNLRDWTSKVDSIILADDIYCVYLDKYDENLASSIQKRLCIVVLKIYDYRKKVFKFSVAPDNFAFYE